MPISKDLFTEQIARVQAANEACLTGMAEALIEVAMPVCPVLTGTLKDSHAYRVNGKEVVVGVSADYGGYVHEGTSRMRQRPWLRIAAAANTRSISRYGAGIWAQMMGGR